MTAFQLVIFILQSVTTSPSPGQITTESPSVLPVILSGTAIAISLISLALSTYNQYFKKPKLRLLVGDHIEAWLSPDEELVFGTNVIIFNDGAQYGALSRIVGRITTSEFDTIMPFRWRMFIEHKNISEEGLSFRPHGSFAGWAYALVIPARQAVNKFVQFQTNLPVGLLPGRYKFEFAGFFENAPKPKATTSLTIELTDSQLSNLKEAKADKDTRVTKKSVRLKRTLPSDRW